jgi:hypothetical protein
MSKKIFYLSLVLTISLSSCTYENEEEAYAKKEPGDTELVAYFKFDNSLTDASTNGLVLNFEGTPAYKSDGFKASALNLDGNSSFSATVGVYDTITVCFWMKNSDELKNLPATNSNPVILDYSQGVTEFGVEYDAVSGATFVSLTSGNDKTLFNDGEDYVNSFEAWNFVCLEIVNTKISAFRYWNKSRSKAFKTNNGSVSLHDGTLLIGKAYGSSNSYFKGSIDELRVYKRALTSSEIASLKL